MTERTTIPAFNTPPALLLELWRHYARDHFTTHTPAEIEIELRAFVNGALSLFQCGMTFRELYRIDDSDDMLAGVLLESLDAELNAFRRLTPGLVPDEGEHDDPPEATTRTQ